MVLPAFRNLSGKYLKCEQWRSQPDYLVPLCKFQIIIIIHCFRNWFFSQSVNCKYFHSGTKSSGWLRYWMWSMKKAKLSQKWGLKIIYACFNTTPAIRHIMVSIVFRFSVPLTAYKMYHKKSIIHFNMHYHAFGTKKHINFHKYFSRQWKLIVIPRHVFLIAECTWTIIW